MLIHWFNAIFGHFPGVPSPGTRDYVAFSASFWAALYSGFVYSIFTGLFTGIAILVVQRSLDRRRFVRDLEREVAMFRQDLDSYLDRKGAIVISSAEKAVPVAVGAIADPVNRSPIRLWADNLPKQASLFQALDRFSGARRAFLEVAHQLQETLSNKVRVLNSGRGVNTGFDSDSISYFVGRTYGFERDKVLPWIDIDVPEQEYQSLLRDPELGGLLEPYAASRQTLLRTVEDLRDAATGT